ncbi:hypothetical protein ES703_50916 [subsurface metagenome]|jgi:hypothetical protein
MATELEELIQYWKDRLLENPPITSRDWKETVRATIACLEGLNELWKESQLEPDQAIEQLTLFYNRYKTRPDPDLLEAVRMGKNALILLSHPTTYCLDRHSRELLRDAQRRESEQERSPTA